MVDSERVIRLLDRIAEDVRKLNRYHEQADSLLSDETALNAVKYLFITAIEGCGRVAQHIIAPRIGRSRKRTLTQCGGLAQNRCSSTRRPRPWPAPWAFATCSYISTQRCATIAFSRTSNAWLT